MSSESMLPKNDDKTGSTSAEQALELEQNNSAADPFSNVPWFVRPSPGINYDFVSWAYFGGTSLALFFYILEKQILASYLDESENNELNNELVNDKLRNESIGENVDAGGEENSWKEFASGMQGMYVVFVPFFPCFLWSLIVRYYWLKLSNNVSSQEKKEK